jgi:cytochrome P450
MAKGNISALLSGIVGAVLNEQLRSMPPVVAIPKQVLKHQDQIIVVDGKRSTLPAGAHMSLHVVGIHRNPNTGQHSAPILWTLFIEGIIFHPHACIQTLEA